MKDKLGVVVAQHDVVQIHPNLEHFMTCFAVVTKVARWGVVAEIYAPNGEAFTLRLTSDRFVVIGPSMWIQEE